MEKGGSGTPGTNVEPPGGVVGLLENTSEMLSKAALLSSCLAAKVLWLGNHVVVFSSCGLQTVHVVKEGLYGSRVQYAVVLRLSPASCVVLLYPASTDIWLGSCYIG